MNNIIYDRYTELWFPPNVLISARAFRIRAGFSPGGRNSRTVPVPPLSKSHLGWPNLVKLLPVFENANDAKLSATIQTNPAGLRVLADRTPYGTPTTLRVGGIQHVHTIGVDPVQIDNGTAYVFDSWSDGGGATHDISVPNQTTTSAFYRQLRAGRLRQVHNLSGWA